VNNSGLNATICPGCGAYVPEENNGCPDCGYQTPGSGRIFTVSEILSAPSYPEPGALSLHDVSPKFLYSFALEAGPEMLRMRCDGLSAVLRECIDALYDETIYVPEWEQEEDDYEEDEIDDLLRRAREVLEGKPAL
jgi:hypothetical protein